MAAVVVVIGPKAGLVSGSILDAFTGTPISDARIHICLWSNRAFLAASTLPDYHILVPPDTEVGFEVHAPGYRPWRYPADPRREVTLPLSVKSGEETKLDIKLERGKAHWQYSADLGPLRII